MGNYKMKYKNIKRNIKQGDFEKNQKKSKFLYPGAALQRRPGLKSTQNMYTKKSGTKKKEGRFLAPPFPFRSHHHRVNSLFGS